MADQNGLLSIRVKDHPDAKHIRRTADRMASILSNSQHLSVGEFRTVVRFVSKTLNQMRKDLKNG